MGYPVAGAGVGCAPVCGSIWSSTGVILVLFILLVIILRSGIF